MRSGGSRPPAPTRACTLAAAAGGAQRTPRPAARRQCPRSGAARPRARRRRCARLVTADRARSTARRRSNGRRPTATPTTPTACEARRRSARPRRRPPARSRVAHLRLFSVYGPGEDPRRLVASSSAAFSRERPLDLTPASRCATSIYVDDRRGPARRRACARHRRAHGQRRHRRADHGPQPLPEGGRADRGQELLRFGAVPYREGERFAWRAATDRAADELGCERGRHSTTD
jgi:hypothetical protein